MAMWWTGLICLLAATSVFLLGSLWLEARLAGRDPGQSESAPIDPESAERANLRWQLRRAASDQRIRRRVRTMRLAWGLLVLALAILAASLLNPPSVDASASGSRTSCADCVGAGRPAPPAATPPREVQIAQQGLAGSAVTCAVLVLVGGALILFDRRRWARAAGALSLLAGATFQGALIKEFKLDKLIDVGGVTLQGNGTLNSGGPKAAPGSRFGPVYLGSISRFRAGRADFDSGAFVADADRQIAIDTLQRMCGHASPGQAGAMPDSLLMIVGSTDRLPLNGPIRQRYDANAGLAQARAEAVRQRLATQCGSALAAQALVLVSGPRSTPVAHRDDPSDGYPEDRRVDVWLLSSFTADTPEAEAPAWSRTVSMSVSSSSPHVSASYSAR